MNSNKIIIISGPSGVGKKTIIDQFINIKELNLSYSISATTREPRQGEINGRDYYFLSMDEFNQKIKNDEFLEWAEFAGNKYGTLKSVINAILETKNVILEIEVQGAIQVIDKIKELNKELVSIFIVPPSIEELERRLRNRNTETEEKIKLRLIKAQEELKITNVYDFVVTNDDATRAANEVTQILKDNLNGK